MEREPRWLRRDLEAAVREVERLTGLESRWNGVVQWALAANPDERAAHVLARMAAAMRDLRE